jgi:hypothetical protein
MELLNNLALGFGVAFTPINLMYCFYWLYFWVR